MKTRKMLNIMTVALTISLATAFTCASVYGLQGPTVKIDGELQTYEVAPIIKNSTVLVPMRSIFEKLGAKVIWDQENKEIIANKGETDIRLGIGSTFAYINGGLKVLEEEPMLLDGVTTMVPLRFVSESLGGTVKWNQAEKEVTITRAKSSSEPGSESDVAIDKLTYKDAINKGVKASSEYQNALLSSEKASVANENIYVSYGTYDLSMIQQKESAKIMDTWAEMQVAITADGIANGIKSKMDNLSMLLKEEKTTRNKIIFLEYKLKMETLKFDKGMTSSADLNNSKLQVEAEKQNLAMLQNKIEGGYTDLNTALNFSTKNVYDLECDIAYEEIGQVDLQRKYNEDATEDPYLWYAKQSLSDREFKLATYQYNAMAQSWKLTELDVTQGKQNLADTEKGLKKVISERYNNLVQLEQSLKSLEISLQQAKDLVKNLEIQFKAGSITKVQVDEGKQNVLKMELEIEKLKLQHEQLKVIFKKPYLSPEYFSAK